MKLTINCPVCKRLTELHYENSWTVYQFQWNQKEQKTEKKEYKYTNKVYKCSFRKDNDTRPLFHSQTTVEEIKQSTAFKAAESSKEAYKFQQDGIRFIEKTGFRCLIADAMGLGKTIQSLVALRNNPDKFPALVIVKSAVTYQWIRESIEWIGKDDPFLVFPIKDQKQFLIPGFKIYLISMDLLGRVTRKTGKFEMVHKILPLGIKTIVADESHSFKDPNANRSVALMNLIKMGNIEHRLFLSGTPIKNRAGEYFTVLNMLAPDHFPTKVRFERYWLAPPEKMGQQPMRIKPYLLEHFRDLTANWVIRREKHEVLKDLPPLSMNETYAIIEDQWLRESYNKNLDLFNNFLTNGEKVDSMSLLGWLNKLRHITGKAKIRHTLESVEEFLNSTETEDKITIGVHHQDIRDTLYYSLQEKGFNPLKLSGEDSAARKDWIIQTFKEPDRRVLVCNMLAGGLGLNIQFCANALMIESEWSNADEEQFIGRFHRNGQTRPVIVDSLIAQGTIDEWFNDLKKLKKQISRETYESYDFSGDFESLRELAEKTVRNRL